MRHIWQCHSLTVVLVAIGLGFMILCGFLPEGKGFDFILGLGHGCWTGALVNGLSGLLREINKPEE